VLQATLTAQLPPGPCALSASRHGLLAVQPGETVPEWAGDDTAFAALLEASRQLADYFAGDLQTLDVPLDLSQRSEFQRRVLEACSQVPYGSTASYAALAARAGSPLAARAVGQVMAQNRLALVIPCHRIVGSSGRLVGYGYGLGLKERLLAMEREARGWAGKGVWDRAEAR
jgi:methylated-DNA-[protein]-cysteine S-methyltransferase